MRTDFQGLLVTTDSEAAMLGLQGFTTELLSHGQRADQILAGADADPECALVNACAGALFLFLHTRAGFERAAPYLQIAEKMVAKASEREQLFVQAVLSWSRNDLAAAVKRHEEIAKRWPQDLLSAKFCQIHQLSLGWSKSMQATAARVLAANPTNNYAMGLLAFAEEQNGDLRSAEARGRRAVEIEPERDPWSHHAVAHVLMARKAALEGRDFLQPLSTSWDRCSSFMYTHNWWHMALFQLELEDFDSALKLYDEQVWTQRKGHVHDQVNAISLLLRLETRGADVGSRWEEVSDFALLNKGDQLNGFVDLHILYALARSERRDAVGTMVQQIRAAADNSELWQKVMLPAAEGFVAHAEGHRERAAELLAQHRPRLAELGGSTIQQQWYDEIINDRRLAGGRSRAAVRAAGAA